MKQENKRCWSCGYFRAYYTMGYCSLLKEDNGYCNRHNKIMKKNDNCDKWQCRHISREKRTRIAVNSIPEIYKKIAVIEQILQEEIELHNIKNDEVDNSGR